MKNVVKNNIQMKYIALRKFILLALVVASTYPLCGSDHTRHLMLFIECGGNENLTSAFNEMGVSQQTTSHEFLSALYQEAGPLLVAAPLFNNLLGFQSFFEDLLDKNIIQLQQKYPEIRLLRTATFVEQLQKLAQLMSRLYKPASKWLKQQKLRWPVWIRHRITPNSITSNTQATEWRQFFNALNDIKTQFSLDLETIMLLLVQTAYMPLHRYEIYIASYDNGHAAAYLFIPKTMDHQEEHATSWCKSTESDGARTTGYTHNDCLLGLKISQLTPLTPAQLPASRTRSASRNTVCPGKITHLLNQLFFDKQHPCGKEMSWTIYLIGHGLYVHNQKNMSRVVGCTLSQFQQLLRFFNNQINTQTMIYSSCYGGGQSFIDGFRDPENNQPLQLNYTTLADVATEVATGRYNTKFAPAYQNITQAKTLSNINSFVYSQDFNTFFSKLNQKEPIITRHTFGCMSPLLNLMDDEDAHPLLFVRYFPAIRQAQHSCFRLLDLPKRVISVTKQKTEKILNEAYPNPPQLRLKTENDIIIVQTKKIPYTISTDKTAPENSFFPTVVSMTPGKAVHQFMSIDASNYFLSSVAYSFFPLTDLAAPKLFIIDALKTQLCMALGSRKLGETVTLNTVLLANNVALNGKSFNYLIFDLDKTTYCLGWHWGEPLPAQDAAQLIRPIPQNIKEKLLNYFGLRARSA